MIKGPVEHHQLFSDKKIGKLLENHIAKIEDIGANAQKKLDERLNVLRANRDEAGQELRDAYENLPLDRFSDRYKLIWTLGMIDDPKSAGFFADIAKAPIPEEIPSYQGHGDINRRSMEANIRMAAIRAVSTLSSVTNNVDAGQEVILETIQNSNDNAVIKVAIVTYITSAENATEAIAYLKSVLPEEDHKYITIDIDEVPDLD